MKLLKYYEDKLTLKRVAEQTTTMGEPLFHEQILMVADFSGLYNLSMGQTDPLHYLLLQPKPNLCGVRVYCGSTSSRLGIRNASLGLRYVGRIHHSNLWAYSN